MSIIETLYRQCGSNALRAQRYDVGWSAKGIYQETTDKGDTYSSTPLLISWKVLVLIGLTKNYTFDFDDVSTVFLHAELREEVYVRPPVDF